MHIELGPEICKTLVSYYINVCRKLVQKEYRYTSLNFAKSKVETKNVIHGTMGYPRLQYSLRT